jgi:hypothetical protein
MQPEAAKTEEAHSINEAVSSDVRIVLGLVVIVSPSISIVSTFKLGGC